MSLRLQINLIIAVLMGLTIGALVYQQIGDTRRSVREEVEGSNLVATQLLTRMSWIYEQSGVPAIVGFLTQVGHVRANQVYLYDPAGKLVYSSPVATYKAGRNSPEWFSGLVTPPIPRQEIPVGAGKLVVEADASRAVLDGWDDLVRLLWLGALVCGAIGATAFWLTGRALKPFAMIVDGLRGMEQGAYDTRLPNLPGKEARQLSIAFNRMAQAVEETATAKEAAIEARQNLQENRELTQMIQTHIEEERRLIARELHDELGQLITAVKSMGLSIVQRTEQGDQRVSTAARLIVDTAGRMYEAVHELIPRLRPFALDSFGLGDALQDLAADWKFRHPELELVLNVGHLPNDMGDTLTTCAYRIVQESVNNALRHAKGTRIIVSVASGENELQVDIEDNGIGLAADWQRPGHYGVRGMRERAVALGGSFEIIRGATAGTKVQARLPMN
jgi:two-component system sensor histidine kinase UhpB